MPRAICERRTISDCRLRLSFEAVSSLFTWPLGAGHGQYSAATITVFAGCPELSPKGTTIPSPARECWERMFVYDESEGRHMGHTFSANVFHVVFATKYRDRSISNPEGLWAYSGGKVRNIGAESIAIGGTQDHVHLLFRLPPHTAVAQAPQKIKANSSRWLREAGKWHGWQEGYGSFSVGASSIGAVCRYIRNQPRHHANRSFEDEFMALLTRGGIAFDPSTIFE